MKTVHYFSVLVTTILSLYCITLHGATSPSRLHIYETYAPAKIVRNYISPLLKNDETLTLFRGKIIVNASAHTHSNINELLNRIDRKALKFLIHLRPIIHSSTPDENTNKRNIDKQKKSIARFSGSNIDGAITVNKKSFQIDTEIQRNKDKVTLLEGKVGYLRGPTEKYRAVPVYEDGFFTSKAVLKKNGSGHYVSGRINDEIATLHLSKKNLKSVKSTLPSNSAPSSTIELLAPLGKWVPIPSTNKQPSRQEIRVQLAP